MLTTLAVGLFFLLFMGFTTWGEKNTRWRTTTKKRIQNFLQRNFQVAVENPWDTAIKGFALAGFILFFKKLIYYVSFFGVIQSKSSIWFVDTNVLAFIWFLFALILVGTAAVGFLTFISVPGVQEVASALTTFLFFGGLLFGIPILLEALKIETLTLEHGFKLFVFAPLLVLKMLCSGKYIGLFTGFLLGSYMVNRYKKLKPEITEKNGRCLLGPGILLLSLLGLSFAVFSVGWELKFQDKARWAQGETAFTGVIDAADSITDNKDKSRAFKIIALEMAGKRNWQKAISTAKKIPLPGIRKKVLKKIHHKMEKK